MSEAPLAIVAGAGALPYEAAAAVQSRRPVILFALDGEADAVPPGLSAHRLGFGQIGRARKIMAAEGCKDILFLGAIRRRPDYTAILGDWDTLRLAPRIVAAAVGGDDTVVRNVLALFESEGYRVVSVADAVPELLAPAGRLGKHAPKPAHEADIAMGTAFLYAASDFDIGQAVAVVAGRIIAVEGAEGTDAMIERVAAVRKAGRFRSRRGEGVLVKRAKRGQDMRSDVPVVGAGTLARVIEAGLGGIAVEAGRTIIAERARMTADADRAGVFVVAL